MRDIFQNHLMQLLALTAMEPPIDFDGRRGAQREGQGAALDAHAVGRRASCAASTGAAGSTGKRCRLPRGAGRRAGLEHRDLRRGEALRRQLALGGGAVLRARRQAPGPARDEIAIQFKRAPHPPFEALAGEGLRPNVLLIHIQPDEGVSLGDRCEGARAPACRSARCTWTSSTAAPSARACRRRTSG